MATLLLQKLVLSVLLCVILAATSSSVDATRIYPKVEVLHRDSEAKDPDTGSGIVRSFSIQQSGWRNRTTQLVRQDLHPFKTLNRRSLLDCSLNPYLAMSLDTAGPLNDVQEVTVTVSGVLVPSDKDWIAVMSPSDANTGNCPLNAALYLETGDLAELPLLCDYPVKFQYVSVDPNFLSCATSECKKSVAGVCLVTTCSGSVTFRLINIRTDIKFVFFANGVAAPCILATSESLSFANPNSPLYPHLSSIDSTGTSMKVTWVSGNGDAQQVRWDQSQSLSSVTTFSSEDMCDEVSPAKDFGWHNPGYIHSSLITGLSPSTSYSYSFGSDKAGWSPATSFKTPPAAGSSSLRIIIYGDMGKSERDNALEHYIQPGALGVIDAVAQEVANSNVDAVFHIGDISYATGFLVEWDSFLEMITPVASHVPYMTAIGNHERDFPGSGSYYVTPDSGGECGVPYGKYFQMPVQELDKPWYSIEYGPVHFTIMSTEHDWRVGSEQYLWIQSDLKSVDRKRTPWLLFTGHRPMYSSRKAGAFDNLLPQDVDGDFVAAVEPLLLERQVDLALWGHVHNFERTCPVYQNSCIADGSPAPIHAIVGMGGFTLTDFKDDVESWSIFRGKEFGYGKITVEPQGSNTQLTFDFIATGNGAERANVAHSFVLHKPIP